MCSVCMFMYSNSIYDNILSFFALLIFLFFPFFFVFFFLPKINITQNFFLMKTWFHMKVWYVGWKSRVFWKVAWKHFSQKKILLGLEVSGKWRIERLFACKYVCLLSFDFVLFKVKILLNKLGIPFLFLKFFVTRRK